MLILRPYQVDAIGRARVQLQRGCRALLLVAPTGAGKTVIGARVVQGAHERARRVLFFAHRRELINQTVAKLIAAGIPPESIGVLMGDDKRARPDAPIQVASIDTWRQRARPAADLVIVDEAHRSLSATYREAIGHYLAAGAVVIGLTATPYRADGRGLGDAYQAMEVVASPRALIAEGFLVAPRVFSASVLPDLSSVHTRRGDYLESELGAAMNTCGLVGGIVEHWQELAEGRRTVAFAVNVEHSKAIAAAFCEAGIAAEHLDGATPTAERDAILARLERGRTCVVSNCGVLCEGWDMPSVKVAILARPTKSTGLYLQQAGRILRPFEDVGALILDHAGNALVHGLPQDDRTFSLDATKRSGSGSEPTRKCPECHAVVGLSARECPECGHVFEAAEREAPAVRAPGKLREVDPAEQEREARRRRRLGLCTLKQARVLKRCGLNAEVSFDTAREAIDAIAANGWRAPSSLYSDPRFSRSRAA